MKGGHLIHALVALFGLVAASASAATNDGPLAILYRAFLSGNNRSGYVTFDRVVNFPPVPQRGPAIGNMRPAGSKTNYVCFSWDGPRFVVAVAPIGEKSVPGRGLRCYGYDGTNYWNLFVENVVTYGRDDKERATPLALESVLEVIPKSETAGLPERSILSSITDLGAECRRVIQFGFANPMEGKPQVRGDTLSVESAGLPTETLKFHGALEQPDRIEPALASNAVPRILATLDFQRNRLGIQKLHWHGSSFVYSNQYVLATVQIPEPSVTNGVFSWQSHKVGGRLIARLFKAGVSVNAEITPDGEIRPSAASPRR